MLELLAAAAAAFPIGRYDLIPSTFAHHNAHCRHIISRDVRGLN